MTPNFVALFVAIFVYIRISKIERWNRGKYSFTHICVVFDLTYLMFDPPTLSLYLSILAQSSAHVPLVSQFGEAVEMLPCYSTGYILVEVTICNDLHIYELSSLSIFPKKQKFIACTFLVVLKFHQVLEIL